MRRRRFVLALGAALLTGGIAIPVSAQTTKIARVGILSGASLSTPANAARFHEAGEGRKRKELFARTRRPFRAINSFGGIEQTDSSSLGDPHFGSDLATVRARTADTWSLP